MPFGVHEGIKRKVYYYGRYEEDCSVRCRHPVRFRWFQEQAGDILEDAKAINEARAAKAEAEVIEDAAEAETTETNE